METITMLKNTLDPTEGFYTFEIVEAVPENYSIWNIGRNMPAGFLPLCETMPGTVYTVNPDTLKALRMDAAQIILKAVGGVGGKTCRQQINNMKRCLKVQKPDSYHYKVIMEALPYLENIKYEGDIEK